MIDRDHDLPVARQARVVNNSRGSVYDKPRPVSAEDLALTRRSLGIVDNRRQAL
jgi:putative transposase